MPCRLLPDGGKGGVLSVLALSVLALCVLALCVLSLCVLSLCVVLVGGVVPAGITGQVVGQKRYDGGVGPVAAKHCPRSLMSAVKLILLSVTLT